MGLAPEVRKVERVLRWMERGTAVAAPRAPFSPNSLAMASVASANYPARRTLGATTSPFSDMQLLDLQTKYPSPFYPLRESLVGRVWVLLVAYIMIGIGLLHGNSSALGGIKERTFSEKCLHPGLAPYPMGNQHSGPRSTYRTGYPDTPRSPHPASVPYSMGNQRSVPTSRNGMGSPYAQGPQHPAYVQYPMRGRYPEPMGQGGACYRGPDASMFYGAEDTQIKDTELETTKRKVTYRNGAVPVTEHNSGGGTADMFTRAKRTVIHGGKFTSAGTIATYDGVAQPAATRQGAQESTSNHEAAHRRKATNESQTVPPPKGILRDSPASRPGVPDPPRNNKYSQPQYVYSHSATQAGNGSRARR